MSTLLLSRFHHPLLCFGLIAAVASLHEQTSGQSTSWAHLPQVSEKLRGSQKYVTTPFAVALSSVGQSRATLVQRLKDETDGANFEPQKASPLRWEYLWALAPNVSGQGIIEFDAKGVVRKVTVVPSANTQNRVGPLPILANGFLPYYFGEQTTNGSGRSTWRLDLAKLDYYGDKTAIDEFWKRRNYEAVMGGTREDGYADCFLVKRESRTVTYLCVTSVMAIGLSSRASRMLNTTTGVYDHNITYFWPLGDMVKIEAGTGAIPLPTGCVKVAKKGRGDTLESPVLIPANPQAKQILEARLLILDFQVYAEKHGNSLPPPNSWKEELGRQGNFPISRYRSFVYVFPGGPLPDNVKRNTTPIGYILGSAGRAVMYGDFTVRWERQ